jgi:hypothetical protein
MTHPVDELIAQANAAVEAMRAASLRARHLHARAELMRHMRLTAAKVADRPLDDAVSLVVGEWMSAWGLNRSGYPALSSEIEAFARAFCRDAVASSDDSQVEIRKTLANLEAGFRKLATTLSDEMAFRSASAHAWWGSIVPRPAS